MSVGRARVRFRVRRKGGRDSVSEGEDGVEGEGVVEVSRTSPRPRSAAAGGGHGEAR
jgi:hypothetical protein